MMRFILIILVLTICGCYVTHPIKQVAKRTGYTLRQVGGISLFGGELAITEEIKKGAKPVYLLYRGENLELITADKSVTTTESGPAIYKIQKVADSIYMLTRSTIRRYFSEDTLLFLKDHVVKSHCLRLTSAAGKGRIVQAYFDVYHYTNDSLVKFRSQSEMPPMSIFEYGIDSLKTRAFLEKQSTLIKQPPVRKEDFVATFVH